MGWCFFGTQNSEKPLRSTRSTTLAMMTTPSFALILLLLTKSSPSLGLSTWADVHSHTDRLADCNIILCEIHDGVKMMAQCFCESVTVATYVIQLAARITDQLSFHSHPCQFKRNPCGCSLNFRRLVFPVASLLNSNCMLPP